MKKQSRLTALLLALCMLMSTLPVSALADGILTLEDYLSAVQRVQQELSEPSIPVEEENAYTLTRTTATETIVRETVTGELSGEGESAFTLPVAGKLELSTAAAADAYQWQIDVGGVWANIVGDTAAAVTLTYAKVQNALSGGTARVRCAMTQDGQTVYSAVATVTVDETVKTQTVEGTEEISAVSYTSEAPRSLARTLNAGVGTYANDTGDTSGSSGSSTTMFYVYIKYLFADDDNSIAAETYTAELSEGSSINRTVPVPEIQGYLAYDAKEDNAKQVTETVLDFENINASHTITVYYKPTNVNYTVKHYQQNVDDDGYSLVETETKQGLTNSLVPEVAKTYEGFYALLYEKPAIAADGSTAVKVYYDRYYYLMNFDLDGGYGVEPIYARYGAPIGDVGEPKKAGYTFVGWSLDGTTVVALPSTMPAENRTYKAVWKADATAKVTVVFWGENADDEEYSYIKSATVNVKPGTNFTYSESGELICALEEHTHSIENNCYQLTCTQEKHTHSESCYTCGQSSHTHDSSCYAGVGSASDAGLGAPGNPSNGYVAREAWTWDGKVIYINGTWYKYTGSTKPDKIAPTTCGKTEGKHTHTDKCLGCGKAEHTHSLENNCYALKCDKEEHKHNSGCYMSGAGLDSNLWKFVKSDTVTVAADGSSVVNVYYDRTEFTLTFKDDRSTVYTLKEKWGADISEHWPIKGTNGTTYDNGERWKPSGSKTYTEVLVYLAIMPAESFTLSVSSVNYDTFIMHYMVETLPGESGTSYNGKTFKESFKVTANYNYVTEDEDFFDLDGFTQWASNPSFRNGQIDIDGGGDVYFYYTRNSYILTFNNGYEEVNKESVKYEAPLSTYSSYVPVVPSAYEPGSVTFGGWYLNPECTGAEYKLNEHKMPADNVLLYAKWVPVKHTVKFYLDKAAFEAGTELSTHPYITVPHGSKADPTPVNPSNSGYTFVGWFYMEDDVEKAFDFANMPVNKDLKVYGKWSSNVLKEYTIYYKIQDTDTEIADPTTGSGLAGITKTFDAKGGTELYAGYQEGYFPVTKNHSLTLDINATEEKDTNVFTFWYVQKPAVPYTVYYVTEEVVENAQTVVLNGKTYYMVEDPKTVSDNKKAVVTEVFQPVAGYMPDAYQKRLVVSVDEYGNPDTDGNVIIFYYTKDESHAYYSVTRYTEALTTDGNGEPEWNVYSYSYIQGNVNDNVTAENIGIEGYTYDSTISTASGTLESGKILELKLYYRRNRTTLKVTKEIKGAVEPNASFVFQITSNSGFDLKVVIKGAGSVTIDNLYVGETYTVKEVSSNWRYDCESGKQELKLEEDSENSVTITNKRSKDNWLDSNAYCENKFKAVSTSDPEGGEQP